MGCYGYPRVTSPFLDRMAADGVRFREALAASSHTAPAHASIFTSMLPVGHRVLENGHRLRDEFDSMAELLQEAGYETAAFTSVGFLQGLDPGFDHFDSGDLATRADDVVDRVELWLRRRADKGEAERPLFLWLHFYDVHQPFHSTETEYFAELAGCSEQEKREFIDYVTETRGVPRSFFDDVVESDRSFARFLDSPQYLENEGLDDGEKLLLWLYDNYDAEIRFLDGELERLYAFMDQAGLNRDAFWIFVADHGQGMGNHDFLGHDLHLYQEQLRVPLIVHHTAGGIDNGVVKHVAHHVDILPTVMELSGRPPKRSAGWTGVSLLPLLSEPRAKPKDRFIFSQRRNPPPDWIQESVYAVQAGRYKYIARQRSADEFYDLEQDPLELNNLILDQLVEGTSSELPLLRAALVNMIAEAQAGVVLEPIKDADGHVEELSALGYLGGGAGADD